MNNSSDNPERSFHRFDVEDIIVHNYSEREVLLKKADKIAREIIDRELRSGEGVKSPKLGTYLFYFPKLTPEAGALRCSVLAAQISREVRKLNPTAIAVDQRREESAPPPAAPAAPRAASRSAPRAAIIRRSGPGQEPNEEEMREAASRALARMADSDTKDLEFSAADKAVLDKLETMFSPVWHARNKLITAYNCNLYRDGRPAVAIEMMRQLDADSVDIAAAKLDVTLYRRAVEAIQFLVTRDIKALLVVPVHFSTIDRLRFMPALLKEGASMPQDLKNLIVFEIRDLPADLTRFRLRDPTTYLKTRARALIVRCGFTPPDLEGMRELGFHGLSVDLNDYDWPESRILKGLDVFAAAADKFKLQSFVHNIKSAALAVGAVASGFTYIEGPQIADPVSNPERIRPFENDMLFEA